MSTDKSPPLPDDVERALSDLEAKTEGFVGVRDASDDKVRLLDGPAMRAALSVLRSALARGRADSDELRRVLEWATQDCYRGFVNVLGHSVEQLPGESTADMLIRAYRLELASRSPGAPTPEEKRT